MSPYAIGVVFLVSLACATFSGCDKSLAGERHNTERLPGSVQARQGPGATDNGRGLTGRSQVRKPLDLTLPTSFLVPRGPQDQRSDAVDRLSPDLFTEKKKQTPLRIKGRLLMNDDRKSSFHAVDGAEIIIEVQTE